MLATPAPPDTARAKVSPRPKGKAPAPPPPSCKAQGPAAAQAGGLPKWQGPAPGDDWKTGRVVNWQPIRNQARWSGSVWEKIHGSRGDKITLPPESLLSKFMTKASASNDTAVQRVMKKSRAPVERLMPHQPAFIADIHYTLLVRKGFKDPQQLSWVLGRPSAHQTSSGEESMELSEEVLEAVLGLLGAAAPTDAKFCATDSEKEIARTDAFLKRIRLEFGPFNALIDSVQLVLNMVRFTGIADGLERDITVILYAIGGVLNSAVMPLLLEGVLLLGNTVNANSRSLGGAVGVKLESLERLANTKCLPKKNGEGGTENALFALVQYLEQARERFAEDLAQDLDACHAARDFDHRAAMDAVQELSGQVRTVKDRMRPAMMENEAGIPDALSRTRLEKFLKEAEPKAVALQEMLEELEEATAALRSWFAEDAETPLQGMLRNLAALRAALPQPTTAPPKNLVRAKRKECARRAPNPKQSNQPKPQPSCVEIRVQEVQDQSDFEAQPEGPVVSTVPHQIAHVQPSVDVQKAIGATDDADDDAIVDVAALSQHAPHRLLVQILSVKKGTVWISWFFDWECLPAKLRNESLSRSFDVLQFTIKSKSDDQSQACDSHAFTWQCNRPPLKLDLPVGCCYKFQVRAVLGRNASEDLGHTSTHEPDATVQPAKARWASVLSACVNVDLQDAAPITRIPQKQVSSSTPTGSRSMKLPMEESSSKRRTRVASNMGAFLEMLNDPATPASSCSSPILPKASIESSAREKGRPATSNPVSQELNSIQKNSAERKFVGREESENEAWQQLVRTYSTIQSSTAWTDGAQQADGQGRPVSSIENKLVAENEDGHEALKHLMGTYSNAELSPVRIYSGQEAGGQGGQLPSTKMGTSTDTDLDGRTLQRLSSAFGVMERMDMSNTDTESDGRTLQGLSSAFGVMERMDMSNTDTELDGRTLQKLSSAFGMIESVGSPTPPDTHNLIAERSLDSLREQTAESFSTETSENWEQTISDSDANALRHLARALSTDMAMDISWAPVANIEASPAGLANATSNTFQEHTGIKSTAIEDDLPDGNRVLAAFQKKYAGVEHASVAPKTATSEKHSGGDPPVSDQLPDGNEVLAAMKQTFKKREECHICKGTGKVGLLGTAGLGFMQKPCVCSVRREQDSVRSMFGSPAASTSGHLASLAEASSKIKLLAAPLWAGASTPQYTFKLSVRLGESRVEVLEFRDSADLQKKLRTFMERTHLMPMFLDPLRERAEGMIRYELHSDSVDVVDLV